MLTAVVTAPGHQPVAHISASGTGTVGEIQLKPEANAVATPPPGPWIIDPARSTVIATTRHLASAESKPGSQKSADGS
ncbi:hypothetical protein A5789_34795 [Nocardia sp. 852002-51101_SCH5132738]|uniref:hypothetical protein n=1 Tax=Nocardia nova TaxID=37330 RepID=UPI0007EC0275|nr:hypothetical protein [Nocardia nova]OBA47875.1 hypothetical protein A5789_34795 [Nocardia sp. 852002-51101_SCH5132738]OBB30226.1 hypothetical protein A5748_08785 [Nocardia sp. 852002-51244_SCH5132740]OBF68032.1 hypothetical protein A9X06_35265 [Mycobacterium sp. 852002-51759_SCH5129042]